MEIISEKKVWDKVIHGFSKWDVAHEWGYFKAFSLREKESDPILFFYQSPSGKVAYPFFQTKPMEIEGLATGSKLYSVYGYTGPLIDGQDPMIVWQEFCQEFRLYCQENKIVSIEERFHPILNNARKLFSSSEVFVKRPVVLIKTDTEDNLLKNYRRKNIRKGIRVAKEHGVVITHHGREGLTEFTALYNSTMERNNAEQIYYFNDAFFESLFRELGARCTIFHAKIDNKVVASTLALHSPFCVFLFLGAMDMEHKHDFGGYLLEHELLVYYHSLGIPYVNDGGGRTSELDDSLLRYKQGFTKDVPAPYYQGKTELFFYN